MPLPPAAAGGVFSLFIEWVWMEVLLPRSQVQPLLPAMATTMDEHTQPLLSSAYVKKSPFLHSSAKWVLKIVMWGVFIFWVTIIFLFPTKPVNELVVKLIDISRGTVFGITGWLVGHSSELIAVLDLDY